MRHRGMTPVALHATEKSCVTSVQIGAIAFGGGGAAESSAAVTGAGGIGCLIMTLKAQRRIRTVPSALEQEIVVRTMRTPRFSGSGDDGRRPRIGSMTIAAIHSLDADTLPRRQEARLGGTANRVVSFGRIHDRMPGTVVVAIETGVRAGARAARQGSALMG